MARSIAMPRLTCSGLDHRRLAVDLGEGVVHLRVLDQRPDHRVPDQVGEADLATAPAGEVVVDHDAVVRPAAWPAPRARWWRSARSARRPCSARSGRRRRAAAWCSAPLAVGLGRRLGRGGLVGAAGLAVGLAAGFGRLVGRLRGGRLGVGRRGLRGRRRARPRRPSRRRPARGAAAGVAACRRPGAASRHPARVGSRRRSRARPSRRWMGRRGTAGTSPRRSTRSGRNPPVGSPAKSAGSTRPVIASFTRVCVSRGVRRRADVWRARETAPRLRRANTTGISASDAWPVSQNMQLVNQRFVFRWLRSGPVGATAPPRAGTAGATVVTPGRASRRAVASGDVPPPHDERADRAGHHRVPDQDHRARPTRGGLPGMLGPADHQRRRQRRHQHLQVVDPVAVQLVRPGC